MRATDKTGEKLRLDWLSQPDWLVRILVTIAALFVFRLGLAVPLPGISATVVALQLDDFAGRLPIFALGVMPLLTVFIIVELFVLASPPIRAWLAESPMKRQRLNGWARIAALVLAAVQALGTAAALEQSGLVAEPGWQFQLRCAVTLIASTALIGWLADQISLRGVGSGLWLLVATANLAALPKWIDHVQESIATGNASMGMLAWVLLITIALVILLAIAYLTWPTQSGPGSFVWPMLVAATLSSLLQVTLAMAFPSVVTDVVLSASWRLLCDPLVIAGIAFAWVRIYEPQALFWQFALPAGLAAIAVIEELVFANYAIHMPFGSSGLVIIVTVLLTLLPARVLTPLRHSAE
jgi:preprotein translocase subunit SecY